MKGFVMLFDYTVKTNKTFDQAVAAVEQETTNAGFQVLYIHNVQETLEAKSFEIEPFKIIEICNAESAYAMLQADIKIGLCMPCKINVYLKDGSTHISGMRPIILPQFFPDADLGSLPEEVDEAIKSIIDQAK